MREGRMIWKRAADQDHQKYFLPNPRAPLSQTQGPYPLYPDLESLYPRIPLNPTDPNPES